MSLEDGLDLEESTNLFKYDPQHKERESEWEEIRKEILGEYDQTNFVPPVESDSEPEPVVETTVSVKPNLE